AFRRQGLLHHLRLRKSLPPLQRSGVGWRAAGARAVCEVWVPSLPMREGSEATVSDLRAEPLRVSEGALLSLRSEPMRMQKEDQSDGEACQRQRADHSAYDLHDFLASRRH